VQYLVNVISCDSDLATPEEMVTIDQFNDRLMAEGCWVFAAGLTAPQRSHVVDSTTVPSSIVDGPFAETAEFVVGFWIWDVRDEQTAIDLAIDGSQACNRKLELRRLLGT
jgi:hypothetical protein